MTEDGVFVVQVRQGAIGNETGGVQVSGKVGEVGDADVVPKITYN